MATHAIGINTTYSDGCIDGDSGAGTNYTRVNKGAPCSANGTVDQICTYQSVAMTGLKVGVFAESGGSITQTAARSDQSMPEGVAGKNTYAGGGVDFTSFAVVSGELLGEIHTGGGQTDREIRGDGSWYYNGDGFGATQTYTASTYELSIQASVTEDAGGLSIPIAMYHRMSQ